MHTIFNKSMIFLVEQHLRKKLMLRTCPVIVLSVEISVPVLFVCFNIIFIAVNK
jgi:hypothetical protein